MLKKIRHCLKNISAILTGSPVTVQGAGTAIL